MFVHGKRYLEFSPYSVGTADKDGLLDVKSRQVKHPSERADITHRAAALGGAHMRLDSTYHFVSGLEVHAGCFIMLRHLCFLIFKVINCVFE